MTHKQIKQMLDETNLPVNYLQWEMGHAPRLPFILFYYPERNDFKADNTNYVHVEKLAIELYTKNKDFATEALVESVLESHEIVYIKEESYIPSEHMYEILYFTEVIINES